MSKSEIGGAFQSILFGQFFSGSVVVVDVITTGGSVKQWFVGF